MAEARCNCGGIKVTIPELPTQSVICYCWNCRRAGGSMASVLYVLDTTDVKIDDANQNLKSYDDKDTISGNKVLRQFCGNCGCPILSSLDHMPGKVFLKGGLFKDIPAPVHSAFEQDKPAWMEVSKM